MLVRVVLVFAAACASLNGFGAPTIFPTGTTIYNPDKAYNGYTLVGMSWWGGHVYLIDMNGRTVKSWPNLSGHSAYLLPGGHVIGQTGSAKRAFVQQQDWDGNVVWSVKQAWMSHSVSREGFPAGYYSPHAAPKVIGGRTMINAQYPPPKGDQVRPEITDKAKVQGQYLLELDWEGNVLWEWDLNDHIDAMGISPAGRKALFDHPSTHHMDRGLIESSDWAHVNQTDWLGPNKWYDDGDERFHPENVVWGSRNTSVLAITSKATGEIVWRLGPDYDRDDATRKIGPILGSHGVHMIPKGLPGAGHLLIFDNGAPSILGAPTLSAPLGTNVEQRNYSRVLEINPVTLEVVWSYDAVAGGQATRRTRHQFYSPFQSNAQRLPNGNTLITEAVHGRIFEVTPDLEIVWEFVEPNWRETKEHLPIFRAYRVPFEYVPQLTPEKGAQVVPPAMNQFRLQPNKRGVAQPILTD